MILLINIRPAEADDDNQITGTSKYGTIDNFCYEHRCSACDDTPSSGVAEVLDTNWALTGVPGFINGVEWVACDQCRPTTFWHAECVGGKNFWFCLNPKLWIKFVCA